MYYLRSLLGILLFSLKFSLASGPSMIFSKIEPLAINEDGEILCKSFYSQNVYGARSLYDLESEVSLCLVKTGEIQKLQSLDKFTPALENSDYNAEIKAYDAILARYHALTFIEQSPLLIELYEDYRHQGFKAIALDQYRLDPKFSAMSFYEKWGYHYQDLEQVVLGSRAVPEIFENFDENEPLKSVQLQYKIGHQIWLSMDDCPLEYAEENVCGEDWPVDDGIRTMYYISPLYEAHKDGGLYGQNPDPFGYEYQKVNAVIFLPEDTPSK